MCALVRIFDKRQIFDVWTEIDKTESKFQITLGTRAVTLIGTQNLGWADLLSNSVGKHPLTFLHTLLIF